VGLTDLSATAFTSERLTLRAFAADDAPEAFRFATPAITRFMSWEPSPSLTAFAEIWQQDLMRTRVGSDLSLVLRLRSTAEFIGVAGVHRIGNPEVETGIWIKEAAHGLGYGREAIAAIVKWGAATIGAAAFIYPVAEQNHASRRLAERLGGVVVGNRVLNKPNGVQFNQLVYRIPARNEEP
jgi:RimJ/RimL family protein N-acetyltransferase